MRFVAKMVSVIVAIVRGDDLEGDFDLVSEVALESTVRDFKERLKLWSLRLANIEAGLMTIYGPFGTEPDDDEVPHLLKEKGKRCHIADTLSSLIGAGMERAYFLVRITVPVVTPAATVEAAPLAGAGGAQYSVGELTLSQLLAKQAQQDAKLAKLEAQQAAVDAELLPVLQKGLFTVLDKKDQPICCGFFVTESGVALTVRHDCRLWLRPGDMVHAVMLRQRRHLAVWGLPGLLGALQSLPTRSP